MSKEDTRQPDGLPEKWKETWAAESQFCLLVCRSCDERLRAHSAGGRGDYCDECGGWMDERPSTWRQALDDLAKACAERDAALETLLQIERETYDPRVSKRIDVAVRRLKGGGDGK